MSFIWVVLACVLNIQERKRKKEEAASAKLLENEKRNKVKKERGEKTKGITPDFFLRW